MKQTLTAWLRIWVVIVSLWLFADPCSGQGFKIPSLQDQYVTALEDSTLKFEALKPYTRQLLITHKLQSEAYEAEKRSHMFDNILHESKMSECSTALDTERKAGRGKGIKNFLIGFGSGTLLIIIAKAVGN